MIHRHMDPKDLKDGQDPSNQDPANAPGENGEDGGTDTSHDISELPEWAQKRLNGAEGALSDLKQTAGVKSVRDLKEKFLKKPAPNADPKPKAEDRQDDRAYVTKEEFAAIKAGYEADEIEVARTLRPGMKLGDALNDPTVKAAIGGIRSERQAKEQIPEPTSRVPVVGKRSFQDLKPEERQANYSKSVEALIQRGRSSGAGGRNHGR